MTPNEALSILKDAEHLFYHEENGKVIIEKDKEYAEAIATVEKRLEALEIISVKDVDVARLKSSFTMDNDIQFYNYYCVETLTQDEYDLLKEVLS